MRNTSSIPEVVGKAGQFLILIVGKQGMEKVLNDG